MSKSTFFSPADWLSLRAPQSARLGDDVCAWIRERGANLPAAVELADTLALLDRLGADAETLQAALLYAASPASPASAAVPGATAALAEAPPPWPVSPAVRSLLEGQHEAEKVWVLWGERGARSSAEGLRRLLLAIIRDLRGVLILLARQLAKMRAAADLDEEARRRLAQLTADIHAPLANRLGIWQVKWELEDLAFRYLQPDTYRRIAKLLDEKRGDRERFIEDAKSRLRTALAEAGIRADVAGRPKHIYSIWKKMQRKDVPFSDLYDIRAVRVLVDDLTACYAALGVAHSLWSPIPAEFDDYIANPKGNNYRSLHTAVLGPEGKTLEIQIRTHEMHAHAELGVAAHWRYKEGGGGDAEFERKIAWMRQLLEGKEGEEDTALLAGLSTELIEDRVYLLTPQGQVIDLPRGGTVLDFAYHVHTEVGHRCRGAKVNGRIVPLTFSPRSGDRVEILTAKVSEPRRDWLLQGSGYLRSGRARDKVRAWFHKLDQARNLQEGREVLDRELKRLALHQLDLNLVLLKFRLPRVEDLYFAVALGDISPSQVARALHEVSSPKAEAEPHKPLLSAAKAPKPDRGLTIEGVGNLLTQLARCCQPVAGDPIAGFLTRGRGVSIHREDCPSMQHLAARHPERVLPVEWGRRGGQSYQVDVLVRGIDRKWLLKDITNVIGVANAYVLGVNSRVDPDTSKAELRFSLRVNDFQQLGELLGKMAAVPGVSDVRRTP